MAIVSEFYVNAAEAVNKVIIVRGKAVAFDNHTINAYYGLQNYEEDDYSRFVQDGPNWDEVIQGLCKPGTQWTIRVTSAVSLPRSALSRYGRA